MQFSEPGFSILLELILCNQNRGLPKCDYEAEKGGDYVLNSFFHPVNGDAGASLCCTHHHAHNLQKDLIPNPHGDDVLSTHDLILPKMTAKVIWH